MAKISGDRKTSRAARSARFAYDYRWTVQREAIYGRRRR